MGISCRQESFEGGGAKETCLGEYLQQRRFSAFLKADKATRQEGVIRILQSYGG